MRGTEVSLIRAIRGPVTLITVGVLFALNNFTPYRFHQTWPVLLIVFGLLSLVRRGVEPVPPPPPPMPPPYSQPFPPAATGGYRQSQYPETGAGGEPASKGGFGTTPRPTEGGNPGGAV